MRKIFTSPALSKLEPRPCLIRKYRSISCNLQEESNLLKKSIEDMPFVAVPGMGERLRSMSRIISAKSLQELQQNHDYGSLNHSDSYMSDMSDSSLDLAEVFVPEYKAQMTSYLQLAVLIACLSAFQVGYNTAVINVPEEIIRTAMIAHTTIDDIWWSFIVSIFCVGGLFGAYFSGDASNYMGRKRFILCVNAFFIVGALFQAFSYSLWMMLVGRFLIGLGSGGVSVIVPLYLGEISPAQLRGALGTLFQFSMVTGIFLATFIGGYLDTRTTWRYLMGLSIIPALLQITLAPFLAESPRWLITQNLIKEAKEVLRRLRGFNEDNQEDCESLDFHFQLLESSIPQENYSGKQLTILQIFQHPDLRIPLLIGFGLMIAQQFSGINAVFYYSSSFFKAAHVGNPWFGSVLATAVNALATAVAIQLMDRAGRKTLLMVSSLGMILSSALITITLVLSKTPGLEGSSMISILSVVGVLFFVTFFELGLGPIPWLISAEIFQPSLAATCTTVTTSVNWLSNCFIGLIFPTMQSNLQNWTFVPFGIVCAIVLFCTIKYIPETKGKTLREIQMEFMKGGAGGHI